MSCLHLSINNDRIATLIFDLPGEKVNKISMEVLDELQIIIDELKKEARAKVLIITSGKKDIFIAGADLKLIELVSDPETAKKGCVKGQKIFQALAGLPIPTIAAIDGVCLGGGLEMALACNHRIVTDSKKVQIGLPEVRFGIIPGWGGTQRLTRLVGIRKSLDLILSGKIIDGKKAFKIGIADRCVPSSLLAQEAMNFALSLKGESWGGEKGRRKTLTDILLEDNPIGRSILFSQAEKMILKNTGGHYPAPIAALRAIRDGYKRNIQEALDIEAAHCSDCVPSKVSKNLIKLYFMGENAKKMPDIMKSAQTERKLDDIGVIGAGIMGGGITHALARNGYRVRLKDIDETYLIKAIRESDRLFNYLKKEKKNTQEEIALSKNRISTTLGYEGFKSIDFVIEAVVEKLDIKQAVLKEVEETTLPSTIFASNTSSIPITRIASNARRQENVIGLHFFNPVHRMPLVEIIKGEKTSDETVRKTFEIAVRIGKTPVVCKDGPGFLVNRLLMPYLNEAMFLIEEGFEPLMLERIVLKFGMPMGPLRLIDEVGFDVACHAGEFMYESFSERMEICKLLPILIKDGFMGRKNGMGFYLYKDGKEKGFNPEMKNFSNRKGYEIANEDVINRLLYPMINEASMILDEKIVERAEDVDLAMVYGTGFPPFLGGPLSYADDVGIDKVVECLDNMQKSISERFRPTEPLLKMKRDGYKFFNKRDK